MSEKHGDKKAKLSMSQTFFRACMALLGGVIALWIALELIARFWVWLLIIAVLIGAIWAVVRIIKARNERW
ncbi:hypothetical protein [Subtercola frigoramans]|uniref:MFS family permease n=1 Tax=Subtercola frigoramans TaxID=120298 RepID=A0ABS2L5Y9_9MICO|nr:hypothetical protein [Subtercola frigoramans]MBM7472499.1 MFS family permease [Subtercola frigoramans]